MRWLAFFGVLFWALLRVVFLVAENSAVFGVKRSHTRWFCEFLGFLRFWRVFFLDLFGLLVIFIFSRVLRQFQ